MQCDRLVGLVMWPGKRSVWDEMKERGLVRKGMKSSVVKISVNVNGGLTKAGAWFVRGG